MLSYKKPTPEQIDQAIAKLIHPQQRIYFFNNLQNPEWIEPLRNKGFFKNPPKIIENASQGILIPIWAESCYLARMAKHKPKEVLKIALKIETNNPNIHENFVDAALQMPLEDAVELIPKIKTWVESLYSLSLLPEKIAIFIVHLAKGSQVKKAIDIARLLLAVKQESNFNNGELNNSIIYIDSPKPQIGFDKWDYQEIIKKYIPELVKASGKDKLDVLKMLIFLLFDAIKFSYRDDEIRRLQENSLIWEDNSLYWRYTIEDNSSNYLYDEVREVLVVAVRDAAEQILEEDQTRIRDVILQLEKCHWRICHRIALYLICKFPNADSNLFIEKLADRNRFTNTSPYEDYEYTHLLKYKFNQLSIEKQEEILSWIKHPEIDWPWLEDQEKKALWIRDWQYRKLTIIKDSLSTYWQEHYSQLVNEFGTVELSNIVSQSEVNDLGVEIPKTDLELESMTTEQLVLFLQTWRPHSKDHFDRSSRAELGFALARIVEKNPERYALVAEEFQGLHPKYLWNIMWALNQSLNDQKRQIEEQQSEFTWLPVINLCYRIVERFQQIQDSQMSDSGDGHYWDDVYRILIHLLEIGLRSDRKKIPYHLREQVWKILKPLTQHPDPTPEREMEFHSSSDSLINLSINTVRGEAINTVVLYSLWIRRHFEQTPNLAERLERGFDEIPEARQVFDEHLNPDIDPSLAIRSIFGNWFPWLVLLDTRWANQNIGKIFPHDETLSNLRSAAWKTYITFSGAYDNAFDLIKDEYYYAIECLQTNSIEQKTTHSDEGLAQHLMTFYWRGKLNLNDSQELLLRFFELASDELRGYAIKFVGRSLKNTQDTIEAQILNNLQLLWEKRLEIARSSNEPISYATELSAFGWWFGSAKFEDSWAIIQLEQVLELVGKIDPSFVVLERLAVLVDTVPESVIKCLELMINKNKFGWDICGWHHETKIILSKVIQGQNLKAIEIAKNIIQYLGSRGYWEYRDLLPSSTD